MKTSGVRAHIAAAWRADPAPPLLRLLQPAEMAFRTVVTLRNAGYARGWLPTHESPLPTLSVGNLTVGGSGKTPFAAWVVGWLRETGRRPAVVIRGYGTDEIAVHRDLNPGIEVLAGGDRLASVREAADRGADCVVLDDGFQHRRLGRDVDVVLIAAEQFGESRALLPRGPWREPLASIDRADAVVVTRKSAGRAEAERIASHLAASGRPASTVHLEAAEITTVGGEGRSSIELLRGRSLLAVTSIARPDLFVNQLRETGADVDGLFFPDHHHFDRGDEAAIRKRSRGREVVMTGKDAVKLRHLGFEDALVLRQRVTFESGFDQMEKLLRRFADLA